MMEPIWRDEQAIKRGLEQNAEAVLETVGVSPGHRVLDYGCGSGAFAIPAARIAGDRGRVLALDISGKALEQLRDRAVREGLHNIQTFLSDGTSVPCLLESEGSDVVLLYDVVHLIQDRESLLRELHKLLKPDGFLSVYPMHLERQELIRLATREGLFILRNDHKGILNFVKGGNP